MNPTKNSVAPPPPPPVPTGAVTVSVATAAATETKATSPFAEQVSTKRDGKKRKKEQDKEGITSPSRCSTSTSNSLLSLARSLFSRNQAPPPPTDPEAVLRSRYGGLLPAHKKKGPSLKAGGHLHQHFDSADWSMAKARVTETTGINGDGASSLRSAAPLAPPSILDVAPPKLAPEPPAPRRASHLGEASK